MATNLHNRAALFAAIALPVGFLIVYWSTLQGLVNQWLHSQDYSHGLLVIPISAYLVWQKRPELKKVEIKADWRALPVLILAVFVFIVGELGAELFTTRISMLLFIFALTWFICGLKVIRLLRFPMFFLLLMVPLPGLIHRNLTFPLQVFSSSASVGLLHALKIPVFREGNVIDLGMTQLQVVEACSGLRYILPLLTVGVLIPYYGQRLFWKRLLLVVATIPIAVFANVARIGGTGLIVVRWGKEAGESFFHSFSGLIVFFISAGIFLLLNFLLQRLPEKPRGQETAALPSRPRRAVSWPAVLTAFLVILFTMPAVTHLGEVSGHTLRKPLQEFPLDFDGWTGRTDQMDPKMWESVGGQDYVIIDYGKDHEAPINFYVAFYELQKKAGDFIHSPRLCLPGSGWYIEQNRMRRLVEKNPVEHDLQLNEMVISKEGVSQLVYFWYQGRNRNFASEYAAKFYMVWDGLWRRRTDGALVRLIMPLPRGRSVEDVRRILDPFALNASRTLEGFLP